MVTDLVGTARLRGQNVALFSMVEPGSELELSTGSKLQLAFVNGGLVVSATGPCTLRVEADGAHVLKGAPVSTRKPPPSAAGVKPTGINWDKMAGLRRPADKVNLTCPPVSLRDQVEVTWDSQVPLDEVELVVENASPPTRVLKKLVPASPARQTLTLEPGGLYVVTLTGFTASGEHLRAAPARLEVLSSAERARFEAAWKAGWEAARSDAQEAGALTLLLGQALELGLYAQAREVGGELLKRRPEDPELRRVMEALR